MTNQFTTCVACGSTNIARRLVSRAYGRNESDLIMIDDVPVDVCRSCGESYVSAQTLKEIEAVKAQRGTLDRVAIPVGHLSPM